MKRSEWMLLDYLAAIGAGVGIKMTVFACHCVGLIGATQHATVCL